MSKTDPVKQFVALRAQLTRERDSLERRLAEIHAALGSLPAAGAPPVEASALRTSNRGPRSRGPGPDQLGRRRARPTTPEATSPRANRAADGTVSLRDAVLAAVRAKPLTRHELLKAVVDHGYRFRAKNPLNSLSAFLYMDKSVRNVGGRFGPA